MRPSVTPLDLSQALGRWLTPRYVVWPRSALPPGLDPATLEWRLHWAPDGGINPWAAEPVPWRTAGLTVLENGLPDNVAHQYKWLPPVVALRVPDDIDVAEVLRGQVALVAHQPSGRLVNASGVQTAGVLDALYADRADKATLGVSWADGRPTLRVWAPTAREVSLLLWPAGQPMTDQPSPIAMEAEPDGCWAVTGDTSWKNASYLYRVDVFVPSFQRRVVNDVTDPYSIALLANSTHSVIIDIDDPEWAPEIWQDSPSPQLEATVDQVIYELHVRDFSAADDTIPAQMRGTFAAFSAEGHGTRHLQRLVGAGLNTVQLLPIFDFTSVEEEQERRDLVDLDLLRRLPADSEEQQRIVRSGERRAFNWGYDPWHYMTPEGGYARADRIDGGARVAEARLMIGSLHRMGLRVVLDQVFNHTSAAGQDPQSVLGRIVPGYYHRRDDSGQVYTTTCCPNVATEHRMAQKLMVDAVVWWVKHYKVDGFRFDLMAFHSRDTMLAVRAAIDELTVDDDGVDGRLVTLYGEGWDFGEVAHNARFRQARQGELGGTSIGTFSDRLRDAVRGGSPFDADPRLQGFGTGLLATPNEADGNGNAFDQAERMDYYGDLIQLGLAGNLADYSFVSRLRAQLTSGDHFDYQGKGAGYAQEPDEVISYVDAHDNETLFDALTLKLPLRVPMSDRVRSNTLCLSFPTLGQSPVLWHAGTDFLRSKSLDRNSYDSGDWFNVLDFSLSDNGFGSGLPPAADNESAWPFMRPLLSRRDLKPSPVDMQTAHEQACELLRLRASSRLFRLGSADAIRQKVSFPVSGSWAQVPGVIVMLLDDTVGEPVDPRWSSIAVIFNAMAWPIRQHATAPATRRWVLHPIQQHGVDPVVQQSRYDDGVFLVPGRTVAVFVVPR